jgi:hypothetical protein
VGSHQEPLPLRPQTRRHKPGSAHRPSSLISFPSLSLSLCSFAFSRRSTADNDDGFAPPPPPAPQVDERILLQTHLEGIAWFHEIILFFDAVEGDDGW